MLNSVLLEAPDRVCIYDDTLTAETYRFLERLHYMVMSEKRFVVLDLSNVS